MSNGAPGMSDREFNWLQEVNDQGDAHEKSINNLELKMELMTAAFNRMMAVLAGVLITVVAAAAIIIVFGRTP